VNEVICSVLLVLAQNTVTDNTAVYCGRGISHITRRRMSRRLAGRLDYYTVEPRAARLLHHD